MRLALGPVSLGTSAWHSHFIPVGRDGQAHVWIPALKEAWLEAGLGLNYPQPPSAFFLAQLILNDSVQSDTALIGRTERDFLPASLGSSLGRWELQVEALWGGEGNGIQILASCAAIGLRLCRSHRPKDTHCTLSTITPAGTLAPAQHRAAHFQTDTNGVWFEITAAVFWSIVHLKELLDIYDINSGLMAFCPGKSLILITHRSHHSYLENTSMCSAFRGFVLLLSVTAATS